MTLLYLDIHDIVTSGPGAKPDCEGPGGGLGPWRAEEEGAAFIHGIGYGIHDSLGLGWDFKALGSAHSQPCNDSSHSGPLDVHLGKTINSTSKFAIPGCHSSDRTKGGKPVRWGWLRKVGPG